MHHGVRQLDVVGHPLFEHAAGGRKHHAGVYPLLVEQRQSLLGTAERVRAGDGLGEFPQRLAVWIDPAKIVGPGTGRSHHLVGRIGDCVGQPPLDHQFRLAADLDPLNGVAVLLRQVPGVGVFRLVEMVVGVPDLTGGRGHGDS